jgi:hypothetical protein
MIARILVPVFAAVALLQLAGPGEYELGYMNMQYSLPSTVIAVVTCKDHYTVTAGDSCWSLRNAKGLTPAEFDIMNRDIKCAPLLAGTKVCMNGTIHT